MVLATQLVFILLAFFDLVSGELYKLRASKLGHSIHGAEINASGRAFFTGLVAPATYCPSVVGPNCPKNILGGTIFSGLLELWVGSIFLHCMGFSRTTS